MIQDNTHTYSPKDSWHSQLTPSWQLSGWRGGTSGQTDHHQMVMVTHQDPGIGSATVLATDTVILQNMSEVF